MKALAKQRLKRISDRLWEEADWLEYEANKEARGGETTSGDYDTIISLGEKASKLRSRAVGYEVRAYKK